MSLASAADRIGAIQTMIQYLASPLTAAATAATATTSASTGASATTATDFARVLREAASPAADGSVTGTDVVEQAKQYLGVPYVFGGEDASGMDCSGLVQRVLADLGIDVPRVVQDQADIGTEVPSLTEALPGDLLVTQGEGHIVIYAGDGKIIHAPRPGKDVQLVDNYLSDAEISTIRRVVPAEAPAVAPVAQTDGAAELLSAMQGLFAAQTSGLPQGLTQGLLATQASALPQGLLS
ncbi:C40 family peptidase [Microbacterium paludicola]|uniref:C40 family peptidase n=1 Tax=Microbacterium paludicola TaxID=300019 RepID=UPI0031E12265